MNAQALTNLEAARPAPALQVLQPAVEVAAVAALFAAFHAGAHSFIHVWIRLGELGCDSQVYRDFLHEALELGGGRR